MKRILIVSRRLDNTISAPKCSYNLALALARLGVDVKIITSVISLPSGDLSKLKRIGVQIKILPKLFANRVLSPVLYSFYARVAKEDRIIVGHGYTFGDDITWVHFPRLGALRYLSHFLKDEEKRKLRREGLVERMIYMSSRKLWAVSGLVKKVLTEEYGIREDKIIVLYNGVDTEKYHPLNPQERVELRRKLGIPEDTKVFIFVGADPLKKGFQRILYALKRLEKGNLKNYVLYAIGFKPNPTIVDLSSNLKIKFLGRLSEENLVKYYQLSDVLLLPSYFDSFSLVVLEAMACGAIPVVTPMVGASEIIVHGENGFIIHNGYELSKVLNDVLSLDIEELREKAVMTARRFSWINIAKNYLISSKVMAN
jgi:glycosyltransferase involved in cell wall biosynthesis